MQATTNSYKSFLMWEEVDGDGNATTLGPNNWSSEGPFSMSLGATTLKITNSSGEGIEFAYSTLYSYNIFNTTTNLDNIHAIWDGINNGITAAL